MSTIDHKDKHQEEILKEEQHEEIVALLKEIRDAINVFKEFVLEVTPQDAKDDIKELN